MKNIMKGREVVCTKREKEKITLIINRFCVFSMNGTLV